MQLLDAKWCFENKYILLSACEYINPVYTVQTNLGSTRVKINPD